MLRPDRIERAGPARCRGDPGRLVDCLPRAAFVASGLAGPGQGHEGGSKRRREGEQSAQRDTRGEVLSRGV